MRPLPLVIAALILLIVGGLVMLGLLSRKQRAGGWVRERLAPCGGLPNCVSSRDQRQRFHVDSLKVIGAPEEAFLRAAAAVRTLPHTRLVVEESDYLHAECSSLLFGLVDDLELLLDASGRAIHVRSASRIGKSDLGANRRRVDRLRRQLKGG